MRTSDTILKRLKASAGPLCGVMIGAYFAFHAINGANGLGALYRLEAKLAEAQAVHADLVARRERLEHRVHLLEGTSLDPDFLEERARLMSGLARDEDIVILLTADGRRMRSEGDLP
jgi:cell division protein FtsB